MSSFIESEALKIGDIVNAKIISIETYGFWIEVNDLKGLVKIVDITWFPGQIEISDHAKVGEGIRVKVLGHTDGKFYASLREVCPEGDPWFSPPLIGEELAVKVDQVAEYGYLLIAPKNIYGLLRSSDASTRYEKGETIQIVVKSVDKDKKRIEFIENNNKSL